MLPRTEFYALEMLRKRGNNIFSQLSKDMYHNLVNGCYSKNSDIATLLHVIAYGDLLKVKAMLDANPKLVLGAGDVIAPSGLKIKRITPLELALSGGHPDIAKLIDSAFEKIKGSEEQKLSNQKLKEIQYERYRPHIENMLNQKPYDFNNLFTAIGRNDFQQELEKFREYIQRCAHTTKTVGMQFNYNDVLEFFKFYQENLLEFNKYQCELVCCKIYGLIMRNYPAYIRQVAAHGLHDVVDNDAQMDWTFNLRNHPGEVFPVTANDDSHGGLGFDYYIVGGKRDDSMHGLGLTREWLQSSASREEKLFRTTAMSLLELMPPKPEPQPQEIRSQDAKRPRCVIC